MTFKIIYLVKVRQSLLPTTPPESSSQFRERQDLTLQLRQYVLFPVAWKPGNQRRQSAHLTPNLVVASGTAPFPSQPEWWDTNCHVIYTSDMFGPQGMDASVQVKRDPLLATIHLVITTNDSYSIPKT